MAEYYDRARLLEEVWSVPLREVAPRYGLSDVGLKKLCARLQIPTPGRGYWAKLKAGKRVPARPELREYRPFSAMSRIRPITSGWRNACATPTPWW